MKRSTELRRSDGDEVRRDGWLWALVGVLSSPDASPSFLRLTLIAALTVVCVAGMATAVLLVRPEVLTAFVSSAGTR
jgi:hypothetical protein